MSIPATTPPSNQEIRAERDGQRKAILAAMQRILNGTPQCVPVGATTFSHLAREAQVGRHVLYQLHPDLKDRFAHLRDGASKVSETERTLKGRVEDLEAELARSRSQLEQHREEAANWKGLSEVLTRALAVLQREADQERVRADRLARRLERQSATATAPQIVSMPRKPPSRTR
jgi:AcrR family transcriptional regulator